MQLSAEDFERRENRWKETAGVLGKAEVKAEGNAETPRPGRGRRHAGGFAEQSGGEVHGSVDWGKVSNQEVQQDRGCYSH